MQSFSQGSLWRPNLATGALPLREVCIFAFMQAVSPPGLLVILHAHMAMGSHQSSAYIPLAQGLQLQTDSLL